MFIKKYSYNIAYYIKKLIKITRISITKSFTFKVKNLKYKILSKTILVSLNEQWFDTGLFLLNFVFKLCLNLFIFLVI